MRQLNELVSVIIPCYNAERWVAEAIESCLRQTGAEIEIIVIDDGSTDGSRQIIDRYSDRVQLVHQENRGGSAARNAGLRRANGKFVQFLDADDFLSPEKIRLQLEHLRSTNADVVYGDWRYQQHDPDGSVWLLPPTAAGIQEDMLQSLLKGWWIAFSGYLFRRSVVDAVGGWDESLVSSQDRDFVTRVAMQTSRFVYLSGCHTVYRRYGNVTISTRNRPAHLKTQSRVLQKIESILTGESRLIDAYKCALATEYLKYARDINRYDVEYAMSLFARSGELDANVSRSLPLMHRLCYRYAGFSMGQRIIDAGSSVVPLLKRVLLHSWVPVKFKRRLRKWEEVLQL